MSHVPTPQPPRLANWLLERLVAPHRLEAIQGDLHEEFLYQVGRIGERRARWRYWRDVLGFARPWAIKRQPSDMPEHQPHFLLHPDMIRTYFQVALRSLWKNRVYSLVSTVGLATGLAATLLMVSYIAHEYSYDRFHRKGNHIVKVEFAHTEGEEKYTIPWLSYRFGEAVKSAGPEVADFARFRAGNRGGVLVQQGDRYRDFETKFAFADAGFFRLFDFPLVAGDLKTVLTRPATVVLTETKARQYFGQANPLGKTILYDKKQLLEVVGVLKDLPDNSSMQFDFLASIDASRTLDRANYGSFLDQKKTAEEMEKVGAGGQYETYLLLHPQADRQAVASKIPTLLTDKANWNNKTDRYVLHPLVDLHFTVEQPAAKIRTILFAIIALFVLGLALINYVNLATARATNRAREVSVRKVIGAGHRALLTQFYVESTVQVVLAFGLATVLFWLARPLLVDMVQVPIELSFLQTRFFIVPVAVLFGGCILLAGGYPAVVLSYLPVVFGLKSRSGAQHTTARVRSGLTVFQFTVSIALIIGAILIRQQLQLLLQNEVGISRDRVLTIPLNEEESLRTNFRALRHEIGQLPGVEAVTTSSLVLYAPYGNVFDVKRAGSDKKIPVHTFAVDDSFIETMKIKWQLPPRSAKVSVKNQIVLNEAAARQLGITSTNYEQTLDLGDGITKELVGVVKDFSYATRARSVNAMAFFVARDTTFRDYLYVKLAASVPSAQTLGGIRKVYDRYKTERPFSYTFLEETYRALYKHEISVDRTITIFTLLAILISCLGLFGLATYTAEQRTKEIGVRKVLGASVMSIVSLLSTDFLKLVLIAIGIATPITWWGMHGWLQDYAYRVSIEWWVFALAGGLAVGVALLTVSFQSVKAALANPVNALRSE